MPITDHMCICIIRFRTALMHAAEIGVENIVELLLLKGADAKIEDINGKTGEI